MASPGKQIIEDARVLTADYLPNSMVHRDNERQEIARNLRPVLQEGQPLNMLVHGPPGTGKTAMARYVVEELKKETFVKTPYVNCFSQKSRFEIFYKLLGKKATVPRDGTSTEKVIDLFEKDVRKNPTVITIDEVDQIADDDVLFEISRFQKAGLILIANSPNALANFDDRVRSRLSGMKKVRFKRYSSDQLFDILKERREYGLYPDTISDDQLKTISGNASGDARMALNSLRIAVQDAENQGLEQVTDEIIDQSITDSQDQDRIESLERLNRHQKSVYNLLQEEDNLKMSELYSLYQEEVDNPKTKRTLRRYLNKMEAYELISSRGEKSGKIYYLE
ncbi:MAG: orc1/cdc6 family replication initiation protein [Candidatus Nanohaloarchaea archaeon]|jgi:orc1/cdc6 family replication initiation protein